MKQYKNVLTKEFFEKHFVQEQMSHGEIAVMLTAKGIEIDRSTVGRYAAALGFERSLSESRRLRDDCVIDYDKSFMNPIIQEWLDGVMLGDGGISTSEGCSTEMARLRCGVEHEEFAEYLMKAFSDYGADVCKYQCDSMRTGYVYAGCTKAHPDLYKQWLRWYPEMDRQRIKEPPEDVIISPTSVMLWYLGDGSQCEASVPNAVHTRLSTDGFSRAGVEFLVTKLHDIGIACHRNNDNRIYIQAKGIPAFFNFIGHESPIKCYVNKFALPTWRFEAKRMREVADELGLDYQKLAYWTKIGRVPCFRASAKGKPRFLPEHIQKIKEVFACNEK